MQSFCRKLGKFGFPQYARPLGEAQSTGVVSTNVFKKYLYNWNFQMLLFDPPDLCIFAQAYW